MAFIPTICGNKSNITLPTGSCSGITFEGVEDTTVNQGEGIDLMDGVTAYDEDGNEIPVTVSPTEIAKCDVGEHTVEYKAIGKGGNLKPYLPCGKGKLTVADCGISVETTERVITITQADPPTISGVETLSISVGTLVNLMDGVSAVDDNGNTVEVEFLGGAVDDVAESDDIATFETDLDVPLKSLKLTLEPTQPCTPWIGTDHDTAPYLHRAMPTQSNSYNRESGVIVGGTVAWNQLITDEQSNFTFTATAQYGQKTLIHNSISGHRYLGIMDVKISSGLAKAYWYSNDTTPTTKTGQFETLTKVYTSYYTGRISFPRVEDNRASGWDAIEVKNVMIIDLTALFGSTIADYIYNLEQANAGAGVAWFKKYFHEDYYPYSQPTLQSVQATAHKTYDAGGNVIGNYALDSSLTLRGIPKLDASNNLYYDGDTYESDGMVTRNTILRAYQSGDESLANAITDGTNTVVYSANASTETAEAYTNPQVVDPDGTEEYVTANDVPVGHDSTYSLVCPISGYDEVSANVVGKNLFGGQYGVRFSVFIPANTAFTASAKHTSGSARIDYFDADGNRIDWFGLTSGSERDTRTITSTEDVHSVLFTGTETTEYQIELGSTATAYEPYQGQTYTAEFENTVYGGEVDLVSGVLTVDKEYIELDGTETWTKSSTFDGSFYWYTGTPHIKEAICSDTQFVQNVTSAYGYSYGKFGFDGSNAQTLNIWIMEAGTTVNQFKTYLANRKTNNNPVQVVVKLATPQTYQLTPQVIEAIKGVNNVWSEDATHVMVIFTKSLTEETQFDVEGLFSASYRAEDECGNETIVTRLINVGGVQAEALENENGIALQTEDGEVLIYVAPTEPVNDLVGSAYVGISEVH